MNLRGRFCIVFRVYPELHLDNCTKNDSKIRPVAKRSNGGKSKDFTRHTKIEQTIGLRIKRRKNQANKSTGWMPRHHTPKKVVASCDKLRGAASRHRFVDDRMGKPGGSNVPSPTDEYIVCV